MREVTARSRGRWWVAAGAVLVVAFGVSRFVCLGAWVRLGVVVRRCPDGEMRQIVGVDCRDLRRGGTGTARVAAYAVYTTGEADAQETAPLGRFVPTLALVKDGGEELPLIPVKGWRPDGDARVGAIALPAALPDGDYRLRARVRSPLGSETLDLPLPVYAPARIHVITDRPLYRPGDTVQFRAVVVRASDFAPVDGRPGRWLVEDPSGETVLEEKAPAGPFGVVAGSFPLDAGAATGSWSVRWASGDGEDRVRFQVQPFTLPRFRLDAAAGRPFYRAGEQPELHGHVLYTSGAPVRGAAVAVTWEHAGAWPPPRAWTEGGLPRQAITDAGGAFALRLPVVPRDLRGRVTLTARLAASDPAGGRVEGEAAVLLAEHALEVTAVTELEDGLVEGFNNRVYLRATTAAGAVLAGTTLVVKRAWEPGDRGVVATTDEDGVASLQLDPGAPVNVVIPPMPVRPPPRPPAVTRGATKDLLTGQAPPLADRLALDRLDGAVAPCARFAPGHAPVTTTIGVRVNPAGAVVAAASDHSKMLSCLAAALTGRRLPAGADRLYQIEYTLASDLPDLGVEVQGVPRVPPGLEKALGEAALDARRCLPRGLPSASLPRVLLWSTRPTRQSVASTWSWAPDPSHPADLAPPAVVSCLERALRPPDGAALVAAAGDDESEDPADLLGLARLSIDSPDAEQERPRATTTLGYELAVGAGSHEELGTTSIVLRSGTVPPIRLRATPVLGQPGGQVEVAILRGPGFTGALPRTLVMTHLRGSWEAPVDPEKRTARFTLPADAQDWFSVAWGGGRALVYVRPASELAVTVRPGAASYTPGATAELLLRTTAGGRGTPAAVGLFGVDATLADLAPLPGPDDMARLRPRAVAQRPAFQVLEAGALEMGRVRGAQAAAATVLRVTSLPDAAQAERSLAVSAHPTFDATAVLTDSFYTVLGELHARVRAWEASAPAGQQMKPPLMAELWGQAVEACARRKEPATDAYGRRLRLSRLPPDLLALTDPQAVVTDGTRRPEDVESWAAWVQKEKP